MSEVTRATGTQLVKRGLAEMLKGGVIMDVVDPTQAKIAEDAGATAVMALERVPSDIRRDGGVARMSDPEMILGIQEAVTVPVMAKARIGHFAEAQVLQALDVYDRPLPEGPALARFAQSRITHARPFVRAWAVNALCVLAIHHPEFRAAAETARNQALNDTAASVRARARKAPGHAPATA